MDKKSNNIHADALSFTGERYVPEVQGNIKLEHLHRYLFACKAVAGKCVLDIACGEGYGSSMLARTAHKITGVDISSEAVSHAQARYQTENLEFRVGTCSEIPIGDASVDVVVSFETIEHHDKHEDMMREIKRVLRPNGILVISSPDKLEHSDNQGNSNQYHIKELYREELKKLIGLHFKNHSIYGQRVIFGSAIFCEDRSNQIESYELAYGALSAIPGLPHSLYLIAVASDAELPFLVSGILEQPINEAEVVVEHKRQLAERDQQIKALTDSYSWRITRPLRDIAYKIRRVRYMRLRRMLACLLGMMHWSDKEPKISQGFMGEALQTPVPNIDNPLISVVMPVYNACRGNKKHLLSTLASIANQTYKNVELIIVDDGSTDDTLQVCKAFLLARHSLHTHFFTKENGGQSSARNFGVKACGGKYIAFIDQDDEWYNDKLEQVVPWLGDKRIDVLYTDADTIDDEGNIIQGRIHQNLFAGWPHPKKVVEDILFKDVFVMPGLMIIKKDVFEKVGGFDENLSGYEDDDLFLRLFEKSRIFYLPVPTLRWRFHSDNYSLTSRMLVSRTYYWRKLIQNYTDNGTNQIRVHMISLRFFWQFIFRSLDQYAAGNELYGKSIDGAREIAPYIPKRQRLLFNFVSILPLKYTMRMLVLARKAINVFRRLGGYVKSK